MKQQNMDLNVLVRYLSGDSTKTERDKMKQWIAENPKKFEAFKRIWETSATRFDIDDKLFNAEEDWEKLSRIIDQQAGQAVPEQNKRFTDYGISRKPRWHTFMRTAAVFLVAAFIGFVAYQNWMSVNDADKKPSLREIKTEMAQRVNLTLSDGTKILLNAGSEIKLPEVFDADKREVFLKGQAYFNVEKNPDKPFVIHSDSAETRVLGTSFSIRAYPEDEEITVAVEEGRVSFETNDKTGEQQTILNNHELARYDLKTRQLKTNSIEDLELHFGWVEGYLKFKETLMEKVAADLERRYGVEVTFEDPDTKKRTLTALLKGRSIRNVLDVISMSLNIGYKINGDQVVFLKS